MTAPYAKAVVEAELRWGDVGTEFERRVRVAAEKATKAAQKHFDRIKLAAKVDLNPNVVEFRRAVRAIKGVQADVGLRVTKSEVNRFSAELNALLAKKKFIAHVQPVLDEASFRERMKSLPDGRVNINLNVTAGEIRRFVQWLKTKLATENITVPVNLHMDEAAYRARLALLTAPVTQTVNIVTQGSGAGNSSSTQHNNRLAMSLSRVATSGLKIAGISALIGAIGGAAGIAAGAVGALVAGLGAVGVAGAAGLATTLVGMKGIGDAFSAFSAETESAASDAEAQAKKVASARKGVESANRGVESANRGLESAEKTVARANKDSQRAQEDLSQAREDAVRQIEDLNFALKGTAIDERDAELALARAREAYDQTFADPAASALDRADAALGVDKALRRQEETMRRNADIEKDAREANEKGVEQSDRVVEAKEKVADAADRVTDAEQGMADAQRGVADAQDAVAEAQANLEDALTDTSSAADKTAQALAKLSPHARSFVLAMRELGPAWTEVRKAVQDNMFAGLDVAFTDLATTSMPMLKEGMGQVGTSINGAAKEFAAFWGSAGAQDSLKNIFAGTANLITAMQPGLAALTTGILDIGNAAAPVMGQLGDSLGNLLGSIGEAFTEAFMDGSLTELIGHFSTMMDGLGGGLNALLGGLIDFGNIVGPILGPLLQTLGESIAMLAPSLGQLGLVFGEALIEVLPVLSEFISMLADGLTPVMPILSKLLRSLMEALAPLIEPLSEILQTVGTALVGAIDALAPAIGPLGEAFSSLVTALAPILPHLAKMIAMLVGALAPALTKIFDAFAPVIEQLVDQMAPIIEQMAPILAEVALALGDAIVKALEALAPMLPTIVDSFSQIVLAVAPFIPQLIEIAADYLPKLIDVIVWLVNNILPPLTKAITWLAEKVLPVVIEGIREFARVWGERLEAAKDAMQRAKDFLSDRFEEMKTALTSLKDFFGTIVEGIGTVWEGLKEKAAGPIRWIIENVINGALKNAWNGLAKILPGMEEWDGVQLGNDSAGKGAGAVREQKFASGGITGVMPGYTPGRDPYTIGVSGGEAIMRPEWTRAMGPDYVHSMNAIARTQGIAGVRRQAGYFANGGIVDNLTSIMAEKYPMLTMTSGYRTTDNGYHSRGMAADFSNAGIEGSPEMRSASQWWYENFGSTLRELIHMPFNNNVKDGQNVGDGMGLYGEGTMLEHRHHLHVASDRTLNSDGTSGPAEDGGLSGWIKDKLESGKRALAGTVRNIIAGPFDTAKSTLPDFGPSMFARIPGTMIDTVRDALTSKALGLVGLSGSSTDAGTTAWDLGAGVEQWRGKVIEALQREGFDSGIRNQNLMLAQIGSESSGNPNAIQQVQDVNSGGNEAVGLLQVIPGTFASYRNPALPNDRTNPDSSMSAALRWYRYAYGDDLGAMWGQGHGYDQGGIANGIGVMPKYTIKPERVLSPEMTPIFEDFVKVLERPDFIEILRQMPNNGATNAAANAAATSGPSTAFDPNNTGYDDTFYNDTVARGGKEGADAWLARQDFGPQIRTWGINALKEIGGEFASPLGLERRWGEAVDQGAANYMRASSGGGDTYHITQEFHGYNGTPQQFAAEVERMARQGMSTLTPV
ncbi:transglycosylase SLT domain-containing protein [Rhodococcus globerulus]|uniref:transglycosylase SLT domain-containing protein n=1 Tax=Rhodococcus globerulus TaxID=33008 RepID=UPI0039E7B185